MVAEIVRAAQAEKQRLERELEANPLYQRLQVVRRLLTVYEDKTAMSAGVEGESHELGVRPGRQRNTTAQVLTGAEKYLARIGRRAQSAEITQELHGQGIEIPGQFPIRVVASILSQSEIFDNIRGQGYGLKALAPAKSAEAGETVESDQERSDANQTESEFDRPRVRLDRNDAFGQNEDRAAPLLDARPD